MTYRYLSVLSYLNAEQINLSVGCVFKQISGFLKKTLAICLLV